MSKRAVIEATVIYSIQAGCAAYGVKVALHTWTLEQ
jgi:hypothetical protein